MARLREEELDKVIDANADGLDPDYLESIIIQESGGDPEARGTSGELGLMQLMPANVRTFNVEDPLDPNQNTKGGVSLLKEELERYDGNIELATAAYNAGSPAVDRAIKNARSTKFEDIQKYLPYRTRTYVKEVLGRYGKFKEEKPVRGEATAGDQSEEGVTDEPGSGFLNPASKEDYLTELETITANPKFLKADTGGQARILNYHYNSKYWANGTKDILRDVMTDIWSSAYDKDRVDIGKIVGPIPEGKTAQEIEKIYADKQASVTEALDSAGTPVEFYGTQVEDYFAARKKEALTQLEYKNRSIISSTLEHSRLLARGALSNITTPLSVIPQIAGMGETEDLAEGIRNFPTALFGESKRDILFEVDEDGKPKIDEFGNYIPRFYPQVVEGVGQGVALLLGGYGLRVAGYSRAAVGGTFFGINAMSSMQDGLNISKENGGTYFQNVLSGVLATPYAVTDTLADVFTLGEAKPFMKGLSGYAKARAVATRIGAKALTNIPGQAAGEAAQTAGAQLAAATVLNKPEVIDPKTIGKSGIIGGIVGGVVGGTVGALDTFYEGRLLPPGVNPPSPNNPVTPGIKPGSINTRGLKRLPAPEEQVIYQQFGRPNPDEEARIAKEFNEFYKDPTRDDIILDVRSVIDIPAELVQAFPGLTAEVLSVTQVRLTKQSTVVPATVSKLPEIESRLDVVSRYLKDNPDPDDASALMGQVLEKRAAMESNQTALLKEINAARAPLQRSVNQLTEALAQGPAERTATQRNLLRDKLTQAEDVLEQFDEEVKSRGISKEDLQLQKEIDDILAKINRFEEPDYAGNRGKYQQEYDQLLIDKIAAAEAENLTPSNAFVTVEERSTKTAHRLHDPVNNITKYIMKVDSLYYALDATGRPESIGFKDPSKALQAAADNMATERDGKFTQPDARKPREFGTSFRTPAKVEGKDLVDPNIKVLDLPKQPAAPKPAHVPTHRFTTTDGKTYKYGGRRSRQQGSQRGLTKKTYFVSPEDAPRIEKWNDSKDPRPRVYTYTGHTLILTNHDPNKWNFNTKTWGAQVASHTIKVASLHPKPGLVAVQLWEQDNRGGYRVNEVSKPIDKITDIKAEEEAAIAKKVKEEVAKKTSKGKKGGPPGQGSGGVGGQTVASSSVEQYSVEGSSEFVHMTTAEGAEGIRARGFDPLRAGANYPDNEFGPNNIYLARRGTWWTTPEGQAEGRFSSGGEAVDVDLAPDTKVFVVDSAEDMERLAKLAGAPNAFELIKSTSGELKGEELTKAQKYKKNLLDKGIHAIEVGKNKWEVYESPPASMKKYPLDDAGTRFTPERPVDKAGNPIRTELIASEQVIVLDPSKLIVRSKNTENTQSSTINPQEQAAITARPRSRLRRPEPRVNEGFTEDEFGNRVDFKQDKNTPTTRREVMKQIRKALNALPLPVSLTEGGFFRKLPGARRLLGYYQAANNFIRLADVNDFPTATHELAHAIDNNYIGKLGEGVSEYEVTLPPEVLKGLELTAQTYYGGDLTPYNTLSEGFAKFIDHYITGHRVHPDVLSWWNGTFKTNHPEAHDLVEKVKGLAFQFYDQTSYNEALAFANEKPPTLFEKLRGIQYADVVKVAADSSYWLKVFDSLVKSPGEKVHKLFAATAGRSKEMAKNWTSGTPHRFDGSILYKIDGSTPIDNIEQLLKPLVKKGLYNEFQVYAVSKRVYHFYYAGGAPGVDPLVLQENDIEAGLSYESARSNVIDFEKAARETNPDGTAANPDKRLVYDAYRRTLVLMNSARLAAAKHSRGMDKILERIEKQNMERTGTPHGYYIPFPRSNKKGEIIYGAPLKGGAEPLYDPVPHFGRYLEKLFTVADRRAVVERIADYADPVLRNPVGSLVREITDHVELGVLHEQLNTAINNAPLGKELNQQDPVFAQEIASLFAPPTDYANAPDGFSLHAIVDEQGKTRFYEIANPMLEAFDTTLPNWMRHPLYAALVHFPKRTVQLTATALRGVYINLNLIRDWAAVWRRNDDILPVGVAIDTLAAMGRIAAGLTVGESRLGMDDWYAWSQRLGVRSSHYLHSQAQIDTYIEDRTGKKVINAANWTFSQLENLFSIPEQSFRLGAMIRKARELGVKPTDRPTSAQLIEIMLAYKQSSTNFSVMGSTSRQIGTAYPFFTARIADLYQLPEDIKAHPAKHAALAIGYLTAGIAAAFAYKDEEWFKQIDPALAVQRMFFPWTVTNDEGESEERLLHIPLETWGSSFYGLGLLGTNRAIREDYLSPTDVELFSTFVKVYSPFSASIGEGGVETFASVLPTLGKLGIEQLINKKTYTGRKIVPGNLVFKPPAEQFTDYTTELAKRVGGYGNMSPAKLDHALKSLAPAALDYLQYFERKLGISKDKSYSRQNVFMETLLHYSPPNNIFDRGYEKFSDAYHEAELNKDFETPEGKKKRQRLAAINEDLSAIGVIMSIKPPKEIRDELLLIKKNLINEGVSIAFGDKVETTPFPSTYNAQAKGITNERKKTKQQKLQEQSIQELEDERDLLKQQAEESEVSKRPVAGDVDLDARAQSGIRQVSDEESIGPNTKKIVRGMLPIAFEGPSPQQAPRSERDLGYELEDLENAWDQIEESDLPEKTKELLIKQIEERINKNSREWERQEKGIRNYMRETDYRRRSPVTKI